MTETKFYATRCMTCGVTVLLGENFRELGYSDFKTWSDLSANVPCCSNPRLMFEETIELMDEPPQVHETFDRVTMVLEDLPAMEEKKCRKRKEKCRTSRRS